MTQAPDPTPRLRAFRELVLWLACWTGLFGICHAVQALVLVVPNELQTQISLGWAVFSLLYTPIAVLIYRKH